MVVDGEGVPLGNLLEAASPAEVKLAEPTLDTVKVPRKRGRPRQKMERLIGDKAFDSDSLRDRLEARGIQVVVPHRDNRKKPSRNDARKLRRYKRRRKVERTFAWLGHFRRLIVRHENRIDVYRAFLHVTLMILTVRRL